ncbi:hypothetical protein G7Y79_00041g077730 [Physcia stellaris]|nr:hypothetical protein G7Y79_00041g077730 [Physcia stellaris]
MLTSRPAVTVPDHFPKARHSEIRAREADVRRYVKSQIPMLAKCVRMKVELQKLIEDTIAEAVEGMFLLARLYVQSLTDKLDPRKIKTALANFPDGSGLAAYNAAYDETLSRITTQASGFPDQAFKAISWITLAQRSLTIRELEHALAVEPEDEEFDEDNIQDMEMIRSVCAGLVVLDEETGTTRFVHYTTEEYFRGGSHGFLDDAHALLASTCITYLLLEGVRAKSRSLRCPESIPANDPALPYAYSNNIYVVLETNYALLDYASRFWHFHTCHSDSSDTTGHALRLLNDREHLMNVIALSWKLDADLDIYRPLTPMIQYGYLKRIPQSINELSCSSLCTAATLGLFKVIEVLIAEDIDVNQEKVTGQLTALHYAVAGKFEDIAALLLKAGADPNLSSREGITRYPLWIAAGLGFDSIVKLLVDKGAEIKTNMDTEDTPLKIAIIRGHVSIAKFLLQIGPDSVYLPSLLCDAAWHGQMPIVARLLQLGVDIQAPARHMHSSSPVHFALDRNHADIAQLLIERGTELDRPFPWDWEESASLRTLLQRAAKQGDLPTVELLLSHGTRTDNRAGEHNVDTRSPLWYACALGDSTINISYTLLFNPRWHHTSARYYLIARALLAQGADVNVCDDEGVTPLHLAAYTGHPFMVQMLLDYSASVNQKDRLGRTALHFARFRKNNPKVDHIQSTRIIEILHEHGAYHTEISSGNAPKEC